MAREVGGGTSHVLDCTLAEGTPRADVESGLLLEPPRTEAFMTVGPVGPDLDREVDLAESARAGD